MNSCTLQPPDCRVQGRKIFHFISFQIVLMCICVWVVFYLKWHLSEYVWASFCQNMWINVVRSGYVQIHYLFSIFPRLSHSESGKVSSLFQVEHASKLNSFCFKLVDSPNAHCCCYYINRMVRNNDTVIHRLFNLCVPTIRLSSDSHQKNVVDLQSLWFTLSRMVSTMYWVRQMRNKSAVSHRIHFF